MHDKPVALITGANQGIGLQVAKDLAGRGFAVLVGSRDRAIGAEAAGTVDGDARAIRLDVTDHDSIAMAAEREENGGTYHFGSWTLERRGMRLNGLDGAVDLTRGEFALLLAFLEAPNVPLRRERLLQATRVHEDVFDRAIDVQILRLRRKLEKDTSAPQNHPDAPWYRLRLRACRGTSAITPTVLSAAAHDNSVFVMASFGTHE